MLGGVAGAWPGGLPDCLPPDGVPPHGLDGVRGLGFGEVLEPGFGIGYVQAVVKEKDMRLSKSKRASDVFLLVAMATFLLMQKC